MKKQGRGVLGVGRGRIATLAALVLLTLPVLAQTSAGKVTEYGIYGEDHALVKRTRNISADKPVRFGFCFEVRVAAEDGGTSLIETLKHPPLMQQNGIETTGYSMPRMFELKGGVARGCSGYSAKNSSALRPGTWQFTLSDGGDDVVVQEFIIK